MGLVNILEDLIVDELHGTAYFLVNTSANQDGTLIKFFLDGDIGIPIEECSRISRVISKYVDDEELGEKAFRYEVSSPGTDMPLLSPRQYAKHKGRKLDITLKDGEAFKAILLSSSLEEIEIEKILESKKGKPTKTEISVLKMEDIKETKVLISFK